MIPIREIENEMFDEVSKSKIRAVFYTDFVKVIEQKKPLLTKKDL